MAGNTLFWVEISGILAPGTPSCLDFQVLTKASATYASRLKAEMNKLQVSISYVCVLYTGNNEASVALLGLSGVGGVQKLSLPPR